jgi:3-oxoacyl-[acyl-carrier-protein] synthase-1
LSAKVYITGLGCISAIGNNTAENYESLIAEKSGISDISLIETIHKGSLPVGEVKISNDDLKKSLNIPLNESVSRTALLGLIAAREAAADAKLTPETIPNAALISATSVSGMDQSEIFYKDFINDPSKGKISLMKGHDCGDSTERIADYLGVKSFVTTVSTACSSSANAIMLGARMIKQGLTDIVIAGGTDALTKFTLNGFNSLMILDSEPSRPFDASRKGLNLGEGAGFVILESEESAKKRGVKSVCVVSGYGNSCDAHHQTATSPDGTGPFLAMQKALNTAGLSVENIDYINAHGTGTGNNDETEYIALNRLFEGKIPPFSSTKAYTGHTLGAAGGIEAVFSALSIKHQIIFPNLRFKQAMENANVQPQISIGKSKIKHVLSNSFGFGGNDSSVIFSGIE